MLRFSSEKSQALTYVRLQKWNQWSVLVAIPVALAIIILSCLWSDISGRATDYTDPSKDWQACFTQSQFITIPLNATLSPLFQGITTAKAKTTNCIFGLVTSHDGGYCPTKNGTNCVLDIVTDCAITTPPLPVVNDVQLPAGYILNSLSYVGIQAIIFAFASLASLTRALKHPTWLPSTIALLGWNIFAILTYYTVNPVLPVPNQTNATLLIVLKYASSYQKYDEFNGGDNVCHQGYTVLWIYLSIILFLLAIVVFNFFISIYAEKIKLTEQHQQGHIALKNTIYPSLLLIPAACFYILVAVSKAYGSSNSLDCISDFNYTTKQAVAAGYKLWFPSIWFPFIQPNLDISTVLFIATFMSVLRGYTIQSVSAFRLAFGTSMIYSLASYAPVVGGIQFYRTNEFGNYSSCYNYFLTGNSKSFFGYPDIDQAKAYCHSFRLAMAGNIGLFVTLHLIVIASYMTFNKNSDRSSMVIQEFDPTVYNINNPVGLGGSFSQKKPSLTRPLVLDDHTITNG